MATRGIACIGSRDISEQVAQLLQDIGKEIVARDWELHSGNANGSDYAFATGGNSKPELVHLHLPWASYNAEQVVAGNVLHRYVDEHLVKIAKAAHPAWDYLGQGSKKLMARNASIVVSSDVVVAFQKSAGKGGTAHGIRIASDLGRSIILVEPDSSAKSIILHIEAAISARN